MFFKHNLFTIFWALLILVLCVMPGKDIPETTIWQFDKIVHATIFAIFALLMVVGFYKQYTFAYLHYYPIRSAIVVGIVYGLLIEAIQGLLLKDRYFELMDAVANVAGCVAGSIYFKIVYFKI